ncbi:PadR family transcriptional regulator [Sphaerisporangium aureirubrum]|uniref:PadR family transcriptional regulator n=1 Tax=Sphaerisporangium aureirubrum TaxID=1544736 RepID=A0ABW1NVD6_9ACTN
MSLRIALLGLLKFSGPASGYDLTKAFERSINYVWQAGHSQIYPELAKMAADGLIGVEAQGTRGRKTYAITPEGSDELHHWMTSRVPTLAPVRSESALQAFLLPLLEPQEALDILRRMQEAVAARVKELEDLRAAKRERQVGDGSGLGYYSLDLGIRHARTALDWTKATATDIAAHHSPADDEPPKP